MTQKSQHSWDMILHYHRCPKCGFIVESREDFQCRLGVWIKEMICERCGQAFTLSKKNKPTFGPLIGRSQPPEVDWL